MRQRRRGQVRPERIAVPSGRGAWLHVLAACTLAASSVLPAGCAHFDGEPRLCGSDQDCKHNRICQEGRCMWPPRRPPAEVANAPRPNASTPGAPPTPSTTAPPTPTLASVPQAEAMFRFGPQHLGRVAFRLPRKEPSASWTYEVGAPITSTPALVGDLLIVGAHDGRVHAVGRDGRKLWQFATGDLIFSSPAIAGVLAPGSGGVVYIGSDDDHLYALDARTGTAKWRVRVGTCRETRGVGPEASRCDVDAGPTIGPDGMIYTGGDGIHAIRPDGSLAWRFPTQGHVPSAPALLPDGTVVAGSQDNVIYAIAPDGTKRWDFRTADDVESAPAVAEDGTVYIGSDDNKVYAIGPGGLLRWAFTTGDDVRASPAIGREGTILVGSFDAMFYAIRPDGTLSWTFRTGDRILSSALVDADGAVLFGAQDDRLYALEPDGRPRWSVELGGDVDSSPVLGPDGRVYVGSDDGRLYELREPDDPGPVSALAAQRKKRFTE